MQISKDSVVSMAYTLTNDEGQVIDTSVGGEPLVYLHGAQKYYSWSRKCLSW